MNNHIEFIGLEDIAAKALIKLCENDMEGKVSFDKLIEYGNEVVKSVDGKAVVMLSLSRKNNLVTDYSDLFEINEEEDSIAIRSGKTIKDIEKRFLFFFSKDVYQALVSEGALKILGISTSSVA